MSRRSIERSREARLWISTVIIPAACIVGTAIVSNKEARATIHYGLYRTRLGVTNMCQKISRKFASK